MSPSRLCCSFPLQVHAVSQCPLQLRDSSISNSCSDSSTAVWRESCESRGLCDVDMMLRLQLKISSFWFFVPKFYGQKFAGRDSQSYHYFALLPPCSLPLQGFVKDCRAAMGFETEGQLLLLHILALLHAQKALHLAPFLTLLVLFILLL